jgi:hypothetical protein
MTIGPDIEEAIDEVGTSFTIIRDSGNVTGEYLYFKPNQQVTKPFIREFFLETWFVYNTNVVAGDIVEFGVTGNRYIVMNLTSLIFENETIKKDAVLYKTNVTPTLYRMSQVRDPHTYHERTVWTPIKSNFDALITTPLHGHDLDTDEQLGIIGIQNHEFYLPASIDIKVHDQIRISSDEYYRVETIMKRRYDNVNVCGVGEDTRTWTTTTTTTTTSSSTTTTTA